MQIVFPHLQERIVEIRVKFLSDPEDGLVMLPERLGESIDGRDKVRALLGEAGMLPIKSPLKTSLHPFLAEAVGTVAAAVLATVTAPQQILRSENHEAVLEVVIFAFDEWRSNFTLISLCRRLLFFIIIHG